MEEVILRAAQLAQKIAHLRAKVKLYGRFNPSRKTNLYELSILETEYALLCDLLKILVVRS